MATYASYKTLTADNFNDGSVTAAKLGASAGNQYNTLWVYNARGMQCHACNDAGDCCEQANGKCCYWTAPASTSKVVFEIWSGGGAGAGGTCCNNCMHTAGGSGGNYAIRSISTCPGCTYSICAGGTWPCSKSHTCSASMGCKSYVNGANLSNFCVTGGCGGWMCNGDAHGPRHTQTCANCLICGIFGADFGIMGSTGVGGGNGQCQCKTADWGQSGAAPFVGKHSAGANAEAWCNCACYVNWPAGGGQTGQSSYCGDWAKCCSGGNMGGSGMVKVTFA
tara:strand:+ start:417 stop:1253 length:837 start_codon:yes stop_codon:yes gene_type:complete